ncbi:hypothetical protein EDB81DRAFT_660557, partial [Dactylonectria macrodidyma]
PAEIFPITSISKGVALATWTGWLFNFVVGVSASHMIEIFAFGVHVFLRSFCFLSGIWAFFLVPETKGKTVEQRDAVLGIALDEKISRLSDPGWQWHSMRSHRGGRVHPT